MDSADLPAGYDAISFVDAAGNIQDGYWRRGGSIGDSNNYNLVDDFQGLNPTNRTDTNKREIYKPFDPDSYGFWWLTQGIDSTGRITYQAVQDSDGWIVRREATRYGLDHNTSVAPSALFLMDSGPIGEDAYPEDQVLDGGTHYWMGAIMILVGQSNTQVVDGNDPYWTHQLIGPPGSPRANKYLDSIGSVAFGGRNNSNKSFRGYFWEMGRIAIGHGDSVFWTDPTTTFASAGDHSRWDTTYSTTREQFEARYARGERRITLGAQNSFDSDYMSAYYKQYYQMYPGPDSVMYPGPDNMNTGFTFRQSTYGLPVPVAAPLYGDGDQYAKFGWVDNDTPNPDYDPARHATDPSEVDGVAERKITGSGVLVVDDLSVVVGVAEREIEINEITQEIKPTTNNLVTGVAERIITVDEGILSADDFLEEQSKVEAMVYTNNIEQSKMHPRRRYRIRQERPRVMISRQTPT